jgi:ABC-type transport system involved in multi-copper enzyme maturation permease subunit
MLTIIKHTFYESLHKRMGLILLLVGILTFVFVVIGVKYHEVPGQGVMVTLPFSHIEQPIKTFSRDVLSGLFQAAQGMWFFLGYFAIAPLITSYMEKGTAELLFTKGITRAEIFIGRVIGALAVYFVSLFCFLGLPALFFFSKGGVNPKYLFGGLCVILLSFSSLVMIMAITAFVQTNAPVTIAMAFLQWTISGVLVHRAAVLYPFIPWKALQKVIDGIYYILPKNGDLVDVSTEVLIFGSVKSWMPIWSTALFILGGTIAGVLVLRRKDF